MGNKVKTGVPGEMKKPDRKVIREIADWVLHIGGAVIAGLLIVNFVIQFVVVHKNSMLPTLQEGNILVIDKISPRLGRIDRGDLVTINGVNVIPGMREALIKRVIALPNEKIEIKNGKVYVDENELNEGYINGSETLSVKPEYSSLTVPDGCVYVLGDNRLPGESFDSRSIGPVSMSSIGGCVLLRMYPAGKIGIID